MQGKYSLDSSYDFIRSLVISSVLKSPAAGVISLLGNLGFLLNEKRAFSVFFVFFVFFFSHRENL